MHKFTRTPAPVDFQRVEKTYKHWDLEFIKSEEHSAIATALYEQQEGYCAYCGIKINEKQTGGHIEHLERRSDNPQRTFDWNNMFFSCNNHDSCGEFKDNTKQKYIVNDIVDPSTEDPADFFTFDTLGNILPLNDSTKHRAEETIRIFNLRESERLKRKRAEIAQTVIGYLEFNPSEDEISDFLDSLVGQDCISVYYSLIERWYDHE